MVRTPGSSSGLSWGGCRILRVPLDVDIEVDEGVFPREFSGLRFNSDTLATLAKENPDSKVRIYFSKRLRSQRFDFGKIGNLRSTPIDLDREGSNLERIGEGAFRWQVRIVEEDGFVIAQTKPKTTGEIIFDDGDPDNPLLTLSQEEIESGRAWDVQLGVVDTPMVRVHTTMDDLYNKFKSRTQELYLILPQIISEIIDFLIKQHIGGAPITEHQTGNWQRGWVDVLSSVYGAPISFDSDDDESEDYESEIAYLFDWKERVIDSISREIDLKSKIAGGNEK